MRQQPTIRLLKTKLAENHWLIGQYWLIMVSLKNLLFFIKRVSILLFLGLSLIIQTAYAIDEEGKQVQLTAKTLAHDNFNISDKKGKFVLIAIWATWCPICLSELPELDKIYQNHHSKGLEIIALHIDGDRQKVDSYLKKVPLSFPIALRKTTDVVDNLDDLGVTPVFYFVGKDGKVIWRRVGPVVNFFK